MPSGEISQQMPVPSDEVFAVIHDLEQRLKWDTLLAEARITSNDVMAGKGVTTLCRGKPFFGIFAMETRYTIFREGEMAAVSLINKPPFFESFTASIRHEDNEAGSLAIYNFGFKAKPSIFRWILEPIMLKALTKETERRLASLRRYLE